MIDLKEIIKQNGLDKRKLAEQLFPHTKFPMLAMYRVTQKKGLLDSEQLSKLAAILGVTVNDLYKGGSWTMKSTDKVHTLVKGEYLAELNTETWITRIFHNGSLLHEAIIHTGVTRLSEYLEQIDNIIIKFKTK